MSSVNRYDKISKSRKEITCPLVIKSYNVSMGGVDKSDMLGHLYCTPMKSRRWYLPIFGYILDLCLSNAGLIYKLDCQAMDRKHKPLKEFRLDVGDSLLRQIATPRPLRHETRDSIGASERFSK